MATMDLAIEIGTSYTSIYVSGQGVVLHEPTMAAYLGDGKRKHLHAVGYEAMEMSGKEPERISVVAPVIDGVITDSDVCVDILREYIKRLLPENYFVFPKIRAILGIPTGLTMEERKTYEDVLAAVRITDVTMIENIMLSAIGADLPIASASGMIVNIGGGVTEIAAISLGGIISACGITIGGNMMDDALRSRIESTYKLSVDRNAARSVKHDIGSLDVLDLAEAVAEGSDTCMQRPASCFVRAIDVRDAVLPYYEKICDGISNMINDCPPAIVADVRNNGICVVGGASLIFGLDLFMGEKLKMQDRPLPVHIPKNAQFAAITGGGKLLSDPELLKLILESRL